MEIIFWISILCILYAYTLYPCVLYILGRVIQKPIVYDITAELPSVSIVLPVCNESAVIQEKLINLDQLDYPVDKLKVLIVSDGSTDNTLEIVNKHSNRLNIRIIEVSERKGKANALNTALPLIDTDLIVFTDASILLEHNALIEIARPFQDQTIGCVSGEDHIPDGGGEGLYGQYELYLRNQESLIGSIVGASGSFYAQRTQLCHEFKEGLAPDFLSVLNTVRVGYRAITQPQARGHMKAIKNSGMEFQRKVRTLLRGMTALFDNKQLLNPINYGLFSLFLLSHKLMRWLVPFFLITALLSNLIMIDSTFYLAMFYIQCILYLLAIFAYHESSPLHNLSLGKIPLFFLMVNVAIAAAWLRYLRGDRQELWTPTQRS